MQWISIFGIYFILWWVTLFAVLPFGVRTAEEAGEELVEGHAPSAPSQPRLMLKFLVTTAISAILFLLGYWLISSGLFKLEDWPLMPDFRPLEKQSSLEVLPILGSL